MFSNTTINQHALRILKENHVDLKDENLNATFITSHKKPMAFAYALGELKKHNLLTPSNIFTLKACPNPQSISNALAAMPKTLATQENLNQLFYLENIEFLEHSGYLLYRIPENQFNQIVFDHIIKLAQSNDSIREISKYIDQLLRTAIMPEEDNNNSYPSLTPRR
ncbi:MAG: hypothetical protein RLY40_1179 [Pseudomonadota bacterium]|jgi:hypothetical protein